MKTTFVMGLVATVAMNLMACVPGLGCAADDPEVSPRVAPLTFEPSTTTVSCDAKLGVVLDLVTAQGSSIRVSAAPDARLGESLPLTTDEVPSDSTVTSASSDDAVQVTLTDAEYNELPSGWLSAAVTIATIPTRAGDSFAGELHFYFYDGRALDLTFSAPAERACRVTQTN